MKRAALSEPSLVIAPAICIGLFATIPIGRPSIRASAVTMPFANSSRRSITEPSSKSASIDLVDVVAAPAALGDHLAQAAAGPARPTPPASPGSRRAARWRRPTPRLRRRRARRRPRSADWTSIGPICSGAKSPSPPPATIAGPPIPSAMLSVATIRSALPASAALPAKQRPATIAIRGASPESRAQSANARRVERRDDRVVGVAGASAAALGEEHRGQSQPLDQLEEPVLLAMPLRALGAGQDHVVVGDHRAGGGIAEQLAVDPRGARRSGRRPGSARTAPRCSRRARWAAIASPPYSTKLPSSTRSARFSRAVRRPFRVPLGDGLRAGLVGQEPLAGAKLGELRAHGLVAGLARFAAHQAVILFRPGAERRLTIDRAVPITLQARPFRRR